MKKKNIIKVSIFCLVLVLIYLYSCLIFFPKNMGQSGARKVCDGRGYIAENKDTIDLIAIGHSDLMCSYIPMELYNQIGITSYNCGGTGYCSSHGLKLLEDSINYQSVKYALIEIGFLFQETQDDFSSNFKSPAYYFFTSPYTFHKRWNKLNGNDFISIPNKSSFYDDNKGYYYSKSIYPNPYYGYMDIETNWGVTLSQKQLNVLENIINFCKDNQIEPLFFRTVSSIWTKEQSNCFSLIAKEKNINYIDLNYHLDEMNIDQEKDYKDKYWHLNYSGAYKVTSYLSEYISENYNYIDRRKLNGYETWDECLKKYKSNTQKTE